MGHEGDEKHIQDEHGLKNHCSLCVVAIRHPVSRDIRIRKSEKEEEPKFNNSPTKRPVPAPMTMMGTSKPPGMGRDKHAAVKKKRYRTK
jgi:hypothetical protein